MSLDHARQFLDGLQDNPLEALYAVALTMGLRQGEVLGLRWEDIDLDTGQLHVRRALSRINGEYVLTEPKTLKSRRALSIPAVAWDALRQHRHRQGLARLASARWDTSWGSLVFCPAEGRPLYGPGVTIRFQSLLADLGLPRQRFHDLRHTAATLMLAQGVELKVIQDLLGHSTIAVTANTYGHVVDALKQDAADRMGEMFATRRPA